MEKEPVGTATMPGIGFGTLGNVGDAGCALVEAALDNAEQAANLLRVGWPGMENYKVLRVIELMGEHVLPYFRKKDGNSPER